MNSILSESALLPHSLILDFQVGRMLDMVIEASTESKGYVYDENHPFLKESLVNAGRFRHSAWVLWRAFSEIYFPIKLRPRQNLLDVGSCIGNVGNALRFGGIRTVGVDINLAALQAGKSLSKYDLGSDCILAQAEDLPFGNNTFDAVFSQDLMEHLPDEKALGLAFAEMERVCRGNSMVHKITVLEDADWIDADESHFIKWSAAEWKEWFLSRGWSTVAPTTRSYPIRRGFRISQERINGYFLLEKRI